MIDSYYSEASIVSIFVFIALFLFCAHAEELNDDKKYYDFISNIKTFGSVEEVGEMLESLDSCPIAYGDLRFNDKILFYFKAPLYGSNVKVHVIHPESVTRINTKVVKVARSTSYGVEVHTSTDRILIHTYQKKQMDALYNELIKNFAPHLADTEEI